MADKFYKKIFASLSQPKRVRVRRKREQDLRMYELSNYFRIPKDANNISYFY